MADAVVIGAGPNGLVAANLLADAGWDVVVLEAEAEPGGAVRSGHTVRDGYVHDRFSSFYPLAAGSPVLRAMQLEEHGLRWRRHEIPVAHPSLGERAAYIHHDLDTTCAALEADAPGDGEAWRGLYGHWERLSPAILRALLRPFPPVRPGLDLLRRLGGPHALLEAARFGLLPVRRLGDETFTGTCGKRLLAGNATHADFLPEQPGSAVFAMVLCGLAQQVGFPVPEGGAGRLTAALVHRLESRGGRLLTGTRVTAVDVRRGRARGVRTADGGGVTARRAVLADVSAPALYLDLLPPAAVPARVLLALQRFEWDTATFKVDWALDGPIPWTDEPVRRAGTVHVARGVDALTRFMADIVLEQVPAEPFLVMGQYAQADPTRQPAGAETAWAYTHVPHRVRGDAGPDHLTGRWDDPAERDRFADRVEAQIEREAPGFRDRIVGRGVATPPDLQRANANLHHGALNGGTAQLHQQLVFRPIPGLGRSETPVAGLYLASSSAHPGGGVHGACGANAAQAALRARRPGGRAIAAATRALAGGGPSAT